jgi:hypothetical protein
VAEKIKFSPRAIAERQAKRRGLTGARRDDFIKGFIRAWRRFEVGFGSAQDKKFGRGRRSRGYIVKRSGLLVGHIRNRCRA